MDDNAAPLDVAIVGGGIAGVVSLHYARQAGLAARVFERQDGVGGLWRALPAWQDIQISPPDWTLADLPLAGPEQPHILANIEAWVTRFGLADGILTGTPVHRASREAGGPWRLETPRGTWRAHHVIAATGGHNLPVVPDVPRIDVQVAELHSSALRDPARLAGRDVLVVGGGASAYDLLDLAFAQGASRVRWVYRGLRWFTPTGKPKAVAGSVRPFARMQMGGMTPAQQNAAIRAEMLARYAKFGLQEIQPAQPFDVLQDQLMPGRHRMLAHFASIERHPGTVERIEGRDVVVSGGARLQPELLLWGTGYRTDLSWLDVPALAAVRSVNELALRCGGLGMSLDADNLYFPGVFLDGIGAAPWGFALLCRSYMSHIRGTARLDREPLARKVNHFDMVTYLAQRDPASFPPGSWQARYRAIALDTPDDQPYPLP